MAIKYFGTTPKSDWTANGPANEGHDFINQINEQKENIAGKEKQYQDYQGKVDDAYNQFKDTFGNRQSYEELYGRGANLAGLDQAREQYQQDLDAVNATRRAMYVLPSTVNANAETRLTSAQRQAALANQSSKFANQYNDAVAMAGQSQEAYQNALAGTQTNAGQMLAMQQADIQTTMQDYQNQMAYANELYNQLLNERNIARTIYGQMYDDEYKHRMQEIEIWADNLAAETARYQEAQANYRARLQKQAQDEALAFQKYLANAQSQSQSTGKADDLVVAPYQNLKDASVNSLMNKYGLSSEQALQMKINEGWKPTGYFTKLGNIISRKASGR